MERKSGDQRVLVLCVCACMCVPLWVRARKIALMRAHFGAAVHVGKSP